MIGLSSKNLIGSNFLFLVVYLFFITDSVVCQYYKLDLDGCVFPFQINGETYTECVYMDKAYPWCSLSKVYKGAWKYCYDQKQTNWTCDEACSIAPGDKYPSCKTSFGKRMYCIDEIKYLHDKPTGKCAKEYHEISPFHTACLPPVPYVTKTGVTEDERKMLVDLHNAWRRNVSVPAAGMKKMYWDDTLAMLAQKHADRCSFAHDNFEWRSIPHTGKETGQNIVMITGPKSYTWQSVFNDMYAGESKRWRYKEGIKSEFAGKHALHYTQIILDHISNMGCGYSECVYVDRVEKLFVCNYDQIQDEKESIEPYKEGKQFCDSCKSKCSDKLCDCKGKQCFNGGKLNLEKCECECHGFWRGPNCTIPVRPLKNDLDCSIPFWYENKLNYMCVYDVLDGYFCSKKPFFNNVDIEFCEDEHFDPALVPQDIRHEFKHIKPINMRRSAAEAGLTHRHKKASASSSNEKRDLIGIISTLLD